MKFNGALVKTEERVIGVAVVENNFLDLDPETRAKRMLQYHKGFGGKVPVVVLLESIENKENYWGRPDLIPLVKDVPLNMMTFKTWTAPDEA